MIICHCNVITCERIKSAVADALRRMPATAITPDHVYSCCGESPNCGNCKKMIGRIISHVAAEHAEPA
jgi:bacterioferritin-associated ferredoxin